MSVWPWPQNTSIDFSDVWGKCLGVVVVHEARRASTAGANVPNPSFSLMPSRHLPRLCIYRPVFDKDSGGTHPVCPMRLEMAGLQLSLWFSLV
jgi:hypothetical protein